MRLVDRERGGLGGHAPLRYMCLVPGLRVMGVQLH